MPEKDTETELEDDKYTVVSVALETLNSHNVSTRGQELANNILEKYLSQYYNRLFLKI